MNENHHCPECGVETQYQKFSGGTEYYCPQCDEIRLYEREVESKVVVNYNDETNTFDLYLEYTGEFLAEIDAMSISRSDIERICLAAFEAGRASR